MIPNDPSFGIAPPRKKQRDPYPRNPVESQKAACEALAKMQASRPLKPPGKR